ncbi:MAG: aspartate carbamoyltransferase catalytic subunit [Alphaproteobacteria bacterium]|nr:aspartate carbamoyltransferase catalytic subunit [Alphaproteobacteria bacterium]
MSKSGWDGILDPGEEIIWQGRPDGKIVMGIANIIGVIFGMFFAGVALIWMVAAASSGGLFWMFGMIHFTVGLGIAFAAVYMGAYKRRNSWYTLTNRRAFIAYHFSVVGKQLKSYPINEGTVLDFQDDELASIFFATERRITRKGSHTIKIGFERIANGRAVYAKFREIKRNAA